MHPARSYSTVNPAGRPPGQPPLGPMPQSTEDAVSTLCAESLRHRAVRHPYLVAMADGSLPDPWWALADFARQYHGYSAHFPRFLTTVISRLELPAHREALLANLTEESGQYGADELVALASVGVRPEWIVGVPHPALFRRFAEAMGVDLGAAPESDAVVCWRELLLLQLAGGSAAEALGALGFGTENIVSTMYQGFVRAVGRHPELDPRDAVFFVLHTAVDDDHQASLRGISVDFAGSEQGRRDLRRGMLKALNLRCAFWDFLLERALDPSSADVVL